MIGGGVSSGLAGMVVPMADDSIKEVALAFAFQATELLDDDLEYQLLGDAVTDLLAAAERIAVWLDKPLVAKLVLEVGLVTEQP